MLSSILPCRKFALKIPRGFLQHRKCNVISKNVESLSVFDSNDVMSTCEAEHLPSLIAPYLPNTFNVAAYVNKSDTLKNLVNMNVAIHKMDKKPHVMDFILKLDFESDMKGHIFYLSDFMNSEKVSYVISKNPMIFSVPIEDLQVRVNYLQSKRFTMMHIEQILSRNPFWLMFSTKRIDSRLGYFQEKFSLTGPEVRSLSATQPKLITYNLHHVNTNTFVIKEEMGFNESEVKQLVLSKPKLWMMNQRSLFERFNYLHNEIGISHETLLRNPEILGCRRFIIKQRHTFLKSLGRAQYNPSKENYVPIIALAKSNDIDFCKEYAKCTVSDFNTFLKTVL